MTNISLYTWVGTVQAHSKLAWPVICRGCIHSGSHQRCWDDAVADRIRRTDLHGDDGACLDFNLEPRNGYTIYGWDGACRMHHQAVAVRTRSNLEGKAKFFSTACVRSDWRATPTRWCGDACLGCLLLSSVDRRPYSSRASEDDGPATATVGDAG